MEMRANANGGFNFILQNAKAVYDDVSNRSRRTAQRANAQRKFHHTDISRSAKAVQNRRDETNVCDCQINT